MTEKQRACIKWICETLGVTYYGKDSVNDASKFISKFIGRAREISFYSTWGISYFLGRPLRR